MTTNLTDQQIAENKTAQIIEGVDVWTGYYRANPHRFAKDFLSVDLKLFQKILLFQMNQSDAFYFIAARSIGKTWLVALFSIIRAILYPGSKIICCSYSFTQGKQIIQKIIEDFMHRSPLLRNEIKGQPSISRDNCGVTFKNGSFIKVVIAGETARGKEIRTKYYINIFKKEGEYIIC